MCLLSPCRRFLTVTDTYDGDRFFTVRDGQRMATPMLLALAVIEISDVVFAVDSIPAVSSSVCLAAEAWRSRTVLRRPLLLILSSFRLFIESCKPAIVHYFVSIQLLPGLPIISGLSSQPHIWRSSAVGPDAQPSCCQTCCC